MPRRMSADLSIGVNKMSWAKFATSVVPMHVPKGTAAEQSALDLAVAKVPPGAAAQQAPPAIASPTRGFYTGGRRPKQQGKRGLHAFDGPDRQRPLSHIPVEALLEDHSPKNSDAAASGDLEHTGSRLDRFETDGADDDESDVPLFVVPKSPPPSTGHVRRTSTVKALGSVGAAPPPLPPPVCQARRAASARTLGIAALAAGMLQDIAEGDEDETMGKNHTDLDSPGGRSALTELATPDSAAGGAAAAAKQKSRRTGSHGAEEEWDHDRARSHSRSGSGSHSRSRSRSHSQNQSPRAPPPSPLGGPERPAGLERRNSSRSRLLASVSSAVSSVTDAGAGLLKRQGSSKRSLAPPATMDPVESAPVTAPSTPAVSSVSSAVLPVGPPATWDDVRKLAKEFARPMKDVRSSSFKEEDAGPLTGRWDFYEQKAREESPALAAWENVKLDIATSSARGDDVQWLQAELTRVDNDIAGHCALLEHNAQVALSGDGDEQAQQGGAAQQNTVKATTVSAAVPNGPKKRDGTPIDVHLAARTGDMELIKRYIAKKGNLEARDRFSATPLVLAAERGHVEAMAALLDAGAEINAYDENLYTALHLTAFYDQLPAMQLLLKRGADIGPVDHAGRMPSTLASGPRVAAALARAARDASTPPPAVALLAATAAGDEATVKTIVMDQDLAKRNPKRLDVRGRHGMTAMHLACLHGYTAIVATLAAAGADVGLFDDDGETPLHIAWRGGKADIIQLLMIAGADPSTTNKGGKTAYEAGKLPLAEHYGHFVSQGGVRRDLEAAVADETMKSARIVLRALFRKTNELRAQNNADEDMLVMVGVSTADTETALREKHRELRAFRRDVSNRGKDIQDIKDTLQGWQNLLAKCVA